VAEVIARHVLAKVGEFNTSPTALAAALAWEFARQEFAAEKVEAIEFGDERRTEEVVERAGGFGGGEEEQGSSVVRVA